MQKLGIEVTYLFNSGFFVETQRYLFLFDYFKDQAHSLSPGKKRPDQSRVQKIMHTDKHVLIFASHSHADHFNSVILQWIAFNNKINYILSNDIKAPRLEETLMKRVKMIGAYEELVLEEAKIKTFGSTDQGVSFLVQADGLNIFHAGDLNWWDWSDEPEEERRLAERRFNEEIAKLKGEEIDLAFFPVDPRLEHNYANGGKRLIKELRPKVFIPMHFGVNYEIIDRFAEEVKNLGAKVIRINSSPQRILL
ncbi:MAG TPA: MBL fold metallo-hydrolase [Bacillota bacterium]